MQKPNLRKRGGLAQSLDPSLLQQLSNSAVSSNALGGGGSDGSKDSFDEMDQDFAQKSTINSLLISGQTPMGRRKVVFSEDTSQDKPSAKPNQVRRRRHAGELAKTQRNLHRIKSAADADQNSDSSDSDDDKKKNALKHRGMRHKSLVTTAAELGMLQLQENLQGGSSSDDEDDDSSSNSSNEEINDRINKIAQKLENGGRLALRTAFRAKIYQISGPVSLVELNEDFKLSQQQGLLLAE